MRILIGSNVHWWNAEAAYAATIAELLQQAGHEVFVLTRPNTLNAQHLEERNLKTISHIDLNSNNPFQLLKAYLLLKIFLKEEQIDIVNAHRSEGFPLFIFACKAHFKKHHKHIPVIRTRGTARSVSPHWLNKKLLQEWTDAHIFAGKIVQYRIESVIPLDQKKSSVIYYPVQIPDNKELEQYNYFDEFNIPANSKVVAIVGRIRSIKGQRILLKSINQLIAEIPELVLLIPFRDTSETEPEWIAIKDDVKTMKLSDHVRFIEPRNDIRSIMAFADVGVVSSIESEVICRVAVEFFSVGVPVIAFPTGCLPEIIINDENGFLTQEKTAESLAKELNKILSDKQIKAKLGKAAKMDAIKRFSPQKMLENTLNVYEEVLSRIA